MRCYPWIANATDHILFLGGIIKAAKNQLSKALLWSERAYTGTDQRYPTTPSRQLEKALTAITGNG